jgi:hypothetical protein
MTVVLEDQVKTITAEIREQFYLIILKSVGDDGQSRDRDIEDVVRAVIALYDISDIARLEVSAEPITLSVNSQGKTLAQAMADALDDDPGRPVPHHGSGP